MKKINVVFMLAALFTMSAVTLSAQENARENGLKAITKEAIQGQLEFLSSDWTEGREAGTRGEYMSSEYIASMFKVFGLLPGGDVEQSEEGFGQRPSRGQGMTPPKKTYFQHFNLVEYSPGPVQELSVITRNGGSTRSVNFDYLTDFSIDPGQVGIETEVPVVFVGYGLTDEKNKYDDFKGIDLKGKFVIKLMGYPGSKDIHSKAFDKFKPTNPVDEQPSPWRGRQSLSQKYPWAAKSGVVGIIEIRETNDPIRRWVANTPFRFNSDTYEGDVPQTRPTKRMSMMGSKVSSEPISLELTQRVINELIEGLDLDFAAVEKQIAESCKPASRELAGKFIRIKTTVDSRIVKVRNVVGVLEGKDDSEIIVVGGHYDHLGKRDGLIFNGADDNASGTVGVMSIAKGMAASGIKPEKTIVFCAWTAEEKGLIGSRYFVEHPYRDKVLCYLNYDMISRNSRGEDQDNKITMSYSTSFPKSKELVEQFNKELNMGLEIKFNSSERPGGGSDHASFSAKDVPIYYFMAGSPAEYHKFNDHVELVNWDKMLKIIQLGYLSIFELSRQSWK